MMGQCFIIIIIIIIYWNRHSGTKHGPIVEGLEPLSLCTNTGIQCKITRHAEM